MGGARQDAIIRSVVKAFRFAAFDLGLFAMLFSNDVDAQKWTEYAKKHH